MDFEAILRALRDNLISALDENHSALNTQSSKDIDAFLQASKEKLKRWTLLYSQGHLTEEDLQWLVKSQKELLLLENLFQAGISKISLGHLKNKIIKIVVKTVTVAVLA